MAYCRSAAEAGNFTGMLFLVDKFDASVAKDDAPALVTDYRKAAEQGLAYAQTILGMMYMKGCCGVERDKAQGMTGVRKAAEQGYAAAQLLLGLGVMYESGLGNRAQAVAWLLKVLENQDADPATHWAAAMALGELKDLRAVEPLVAALRDGDRDFRRVAAGALILLNGLADA